MITDATEKQVLCAEYCRVHAGMRAKERDVQISLLKGVFELGDAVEGLFFVYNSTHTYNDFVVVENLSHLDALIGKVLGVEHGILTREFRLMLDGAYIYRLNCGPAIELHFVHMGTLLNKIKRGMPRLSGATVPIDPYLFTFNRTGLGLKTSEYLKKQGYAQIASEVEVKGSYRRDSDIDSYYEEFGSLNLAYVLTQIEALSSLVNLELEAVR